MNAKELLESYIYVTAKELNELHSIKWPQDRQALENRIDSLHGLICSSVDQTNVYDKVS